MDWKALVSTAAPGLATLLAGPGAGVAVKILADKLLGGSTGDPVADEAKIAGMLAGGLTPELRARLVEAETTLAVKRIEAKVEGRRIDAGLETAYLGDVANARGVHGTNDSVMVLARGVLIGWLVLTLGTLVGLYQVLIGGIKITDVGIVATVFTVLGSTVGYVSNSAQQVLSYYFGSSRGSDRKTTGLMEAVTNSGKRLG